MGLSDRNYYRPSGLGGFRFFPPVIKGLLIVTTVAFIFQLIINNLSFSGVPGWYYLDRYFALNPIIGVDPAGRAFNFQIWQLITYQFMHGGFWHIFFNMLLLWMFGIEIENLWGSKKFLVFYLLSGIGGGLTQVFISPLISNFAAFTIGASGAVFGVMIAFGMTFPNRYIFMIFPPIPIKAKYLIAFLVVFEYLSVGNANEPIAHLVHLGGAFTAFVFILYDRRHNVNYDRLFKKAKNIFNQPVKKKYPFRAPLDNLKNKDAVEDAEFYEINEKKKKKDITQDEIDRILDKISKSGYQNLTDEEKKTLFEASKRK